MKSPRLAMFGAAMAFLAVPTLTASAGAQPAADSSSVIRYDAKLAEIPGATIFTQQGEATPEGSCRFTGGDEGRPTGKGQVVVMREVSFDPTTCKRDLAKAVYTKDALPPAIAAKVDKEPPAPKVSMVGPALPSARPAESTAAFGSWYGSLKVNVEDPPQIDVTSTKSYLSYWNEWDGFHSWHTPQWDWMSASGWTNKEAYWWYYNDGQLATTNTQGKFRNGIFCAFVDTWTEHEWTVFGGRPDGSWFWNYSVNKWGGCTWAAARWVRMLPHPPASCDDDSESA